MPADQPDTTGGDAGSATNLDENIRNGRSQSTEAPRTEVPIHVVLVDPFEAIAQGEAEVMEVAGLLEILALALDRLGETYGLDPWVKRQIGNAQRMALIGSDRLNEAAERIGAGDTTLHEAQVPRQFRRAA